MIFLTDRSVKLVKVWYFNKQNMRIPFHVTNVLRMSNKKFLDLFDSDMISVTRSSSSEVYTVKKYLDFKGVKFD